MSTTQSTPSSDKARSGLLLIKGKGLPEQATRTTTVSKTELIDLMHSEKQLDDLSEELWQLRRLLARKKADALKRLTAEAAHDPAGAADPFTCECGATLCDIAGSGLRAKLCPVCDADASAFREDEL